MTLALLVSFWEPGHSQECEVSEINNQIIPLRLYILSSEGKPVVIHLPLRVMPS